MTVLVGVISQKGGVGKSTLARLIAREYAAAGWDVKIADLDISQGTSTDWKQRLVGDKDNEIEEARSYIHKAGYSTFAGSIPEKTAYRQASDSGRAVSEVTFPTLRQRAEEVAQGIINKLSKQEA